MLQRQVEVVGDYGVVRHLRDELWADLPRIEVVEPQPAQIINGREHPDEVDQARFMGADPILGPEMKSTGEVMGVGATFAEAFTKAALGAGDKIQITVFWSL